MNKKADITIIILVLGIIAVCFFAIITFINSNTSTQNNFKNLRIIWDMNQRIETGIFGRPFFRKESANKKIFYEYSLMKYPMFSSSPKTLFKIKYFPHLGK